MSEATLEPIEELEPNPSVREGLDLLERWNIIHEHGTEERTAAERFKIWFFQNRFVFFGVSSTVLQLVLVYHFAIAGERIDMGVEFADEISFMTDLSIQQPASQAVSQGEIEASDDLNKKKEDPRIASAQNPYKVGALLPTDLTPTIRPDYTAAARAAGVEGMLVLQLVVADSGDVLRVRVLSKALGYGLERSAIRAFRKKKFKPARLNGKPITVKFNFPVRFKLSL